MKKKVIATFLSLMLVTLMFGCGKAGETKAPEAEIQTEGTQTAEESTVTQVIFSGDTLDGGVFTQDDLADYDITMVNVWGTFCPPCLEEMPYLQMLYEDMPEKSNMVLICVDTDTDEDTALEIVEELKLTMPIMKMDPELSEVLISDVEAIPTTFFLDKNGNRVGEVIIGAPKNLENAVAEYREAVQGALDEVAK